MKLILGTGKTTPILVSHTQNHTHFSKAHLILLVVRTLCVAFFTVSKQLIIKQLNWKSVKSALPPETEARNRKLTVFAMSLYFFFCVLWAYFVVTGTNRGLQQAKYEE